MSAFEPISRAHDGFVDILHVGRSVAGGFFYYVMELADDQISGAENRDHSLCSENAQGGAGSHLASR